MAEMITAIVLIGITKCQVSQSWIFKNLVVDSHREFLLRNRAGKTCLWKKNIFCPMNVYKSKGKIIFEIVHWPFKLPPNQHRPAGPSGWIYWCMSAWPSKGQCRNSKIFPPLLLYIKVDQNDFFPEMCFAYTIFVSEFTV